MKHNISVFQFALIIANTIITASLITLPQIMTQLSEQNTWLVPLITYPLVLFILLLCFKGEIHSIHEDPKSRLNKLFTIILGIFLLTTYLRDLRAFIDYISFYLLPNTPIEVISIVLSITLLYISASGLEVIARITVIQFVVLAVLILALPMLTVNEIDITNVVPIINKDGMFNMMKASFIFFPWMGEAFIAFYLVRFIGKKKDLNKGILLGVSLGFLLFFVLIITDIAVLGEQIVSDATYPNIIMIQEINITDFLDRIDLIIVIIWMPTLLSKLALTLYCIHKALFQLKGKNSTELLPPLSLFLGILAIILFESNIQHLEYSFYTWTTIGIILEMVILIFFVVLKVKKHLKEKKADNQSNTH
ncbi:GerAB/ArcD/ProY family transporter [Metabacillus litoralis]|uniref:GerAB/ArcD/ProY family transporter n=1 Tax=Metabacillus litoralis TaxID=152268 RepID=UPI000EF60454|nr:endospore germination permease [Metabacillus litoralis]